MADKTIIAWTSHTFNIAWGCFKVSPGCKNCYADTLSQRYGQSRIWGPPATTDRRVFGDKHWAEPLKWNKDAQRAGEPARVFSSSMCDNFEDHPTIARERDRLWALIRQTPMLHWQLLTKRSHRIRECLPPDWGPAGYPNVWLGVSIESDDYVGRADDLRAIPAVVRFISYEPVLGPLPSLNLAGIDWLIAGGESGSKYRMPLAGQTAVAQLLTKEQRQTADLEWWDIMRTMRRRCDDAGTAFFYKQSAAARTEMGIHMDGELVRFYPTPRKVA